MGIEPTTPSLPCVLVCAGVRFLSAISLNVVSVPVGVSGSWRGTSLVDLSVA